MDCSPSPRGDTSNTAHSPNAGLMLAQRRRVFAGHTITYTAQYRVNNIVRVTCIAMCDRELGGGEE